MAMVKATIIKKEDGHNTGYKTVETERTIEAENIDALMVLFFKKYDNGLKYCNNLFYRFKDDTLKAEYRAWVSDINNYANNGGDMW